jgi:hypothetical protein
MSDVSLSRSFQHIVSAFRSFFLDLLQILDFLCVEAVVASDGFHSRVTDQSQAQCFREIDGREVLRTDFDKLAKFVSGVLPGSASLLVLSDCSGESLLSSRMSEKLSEYAVACIGKNVSVR